METEESQKNINLNDSIRKALLRNIKWASIFAITGIAFNALNLVSGIIGMVTLYRNTNIPFSFFQLFTPLTLCAVIAIDIVLIYYATKMKEAVKTSDSTKIEEGINILTNYFTSYLVVLVVMILSTIVGIALAFFFPFSF